MGGNKKILVVDDDTSVVESLCQYLAREGFDVEGESDSVAALRELESSEYGILITDILMPELDGIELLRAAKQKNPFLQVILITAHVRLSYLLEGFAAGATNCFFKPFTSMAPVAQEAESCLRKIDRIHEVLVQRAKMG
jgi:DNA-binding NtrC family response regulator